jgi:hypothetical protein
LTLTLYGVDAQGGTVSQAQGSAQAFLIQLNNPTMFEVTLQTVGGEVRYFDVQQRNTKVDAFPRAKH